MGLGSEIRDAEKTFPESWISGLKMYRIRIRNTVPAIAFPR
jgi:hypothetical protein